MGVLRSQGFHMSNYRKVSDQSNILKKEKLKEKEKKEKKKEEEVDKVKITKSKSS